MPEKSKGPKGLSPAGRKKFLVVMREYKAGTLRSGGGGKVTSREQALAIAFSEGRKHKGS